jgi:hypothetical protein
MIQDHVHNVESAACRLRSRFSQAVDAPLAVRRQVLDEELSEILKDTLPADRRRLLSDLVKRFPVWGADAPMEIAENSRDLGKRVEQLEAELKNPLRLVERLREVLPQLPDDQRRAVEQALISGGTIKAGLGEAGAKAIRDRLGLPATAPVDAQRLAEVSSALIEAMLVIDDSLATGFSTYCGQNLFDKGGFKARLTSALADKAPASTMKDVRDRAWLVRVMASMYVKLYGDGHRVALQSFFLQRFKPSVFEAMIRASETRKPKGMWTDAGVSAHFWAEYKKDFDALELNQDDLKKAFLRQAGDEVLRQFKKYQDIQATRPGGI